MNAQATCVSSECLGGFKASQFNGVKRGCWAPWVAFRAHQVESKPAWWQCWRRAQAATYGVNVRIMGLTPPPTGPRRSDRVDVSGLRA